MFLYVLVDEGVVGQLEIPLFSKASFLSFFLACLRVL